MRVIKAEPVIVNRMVEITLKDSDTGEIMAPYEIPFNIADLLNNTITKEKFEKKCRITILLRMKEIFPKRKLVVENLRIKE